MHYLRLQHDWQDIEEDFLRSDTDFESAFAATQRCLIDMHAPDLRVQVQDSIS